MKGEAIARVRRQQALEKANRHDIDGREALERLKNMYSFRPKDYAGTYGGYVNPIIALRPRWQFWK